MFPKASASPQDCLSAMFHMMPGYKKRVLRGAHRWQTAEEVLVGFGVDEFGGAADIKGEQRRATATSARV